jgi:hypothetical protein
MKTAFLLGAIVLLAAPLPGRNNTDVIILKNGDRITGEIKGLQGGVLKVDLSYVDGSLSVHWLKVASVESKQLFVIHAQDGSTYTGTLSMAAAQADKIKIAGGETPETVVDHSQIVKMEETSNSFVDGWSGDLSIGLVYTKGNRSTQNTFGSELEYRRSRWGMGAAYNSSRSGNEGAETSSRYQLDLLGNRQLPWKNYYYGGIGTFLRSSVQGIDLQTTIGGGIGRYFKNTNRARVSVMAGLSWQGTDYQDSAYDVQAQKALGGLFVTDIRIFVFKKTNLSLRGTVIPSFSDPNRLRFNTNASYYLKLFRNLNWNLSFYGNWDTAPPPHFSGSDYGYSLGLSWKFGYR